MTEVDFSVYIDLPQFGVDSRQEEEISIKKAIHDLNVENFGLKENPTYKGGWRPSAVDIGWIQNSLKMLINEKKWPSEKFKFKDLEKGIEAFLGWAVQNFTKIYIDFYHYFHSRVLNKYNLSPAFQKAQEMQSLLDDSPATPRYISIYVRFWTKDDYGHYEYGFPLTLERELLWDF